MLLLPKSFVETYLNDLDDEDRVEIMTLIFNWYLEIEVPTTTNKLVKVIFNNLLPILEGHKQNYINGQKGGAPKNNTNAKKTTPLVLDNNPKTTPLVLDNNPKTTPLEKQNNPKEKDIDKEKDKDIDKEKLKKSIEIFSYENLDIEEEIDIFSQEALELAEKEFNKLQNKELQAI